MKNKGCLIAVAVIVVFVLAVGGWMVGRYNSMVDLRSGQNGYEKVWADVEAQYQRRSDLIPNLVSTVKGYADFEQKTLTDVIEARAKATQITVDPTNLSAEQLAKYQSAQSGLVRGVESFDGCGGKLPGPESQPEFPGTPISIGRHGKPYSGRPAAF